MVTERTIINALIIGASFILVPFIVSSTLTFDYAPLLFVGVLSAFLAAFFLFKDSLCIWPLLASCIAGTLNFLPIPLTASQIFCIMLVLYYTTGYVIIKKRRIKLGMLKFFWPILIITLILIYHHHDPHLRVLGGNMEGDKPALLIYLVVLAYFCGINVASPSVDLLSKVPLYVVILTGFSCIPYLLTSYVPGLAPYVFTVTNAVNVEAYVNTLPGVATGEPSGIGRFAVFGPLGGTLQVYLLCHYPLGTWLRPERWWVAGLSLICLALAITSGYRNVLFTFAIITLIGAWCYHSWRSLFLLAGLFIGLLMLLVCSGDNLIHLPTNKLPMIAQRTMSFLPGDWDQEAIESAKSSNDFRKGIQELYKKEYMAKSPLLGNGFSINKQEFETSGNALTQRGAGIDSTYLQSKVFIEGKLFHIGWISVYDCVGIIGALAFVILGCIEILVTLHFVFGPKANRRSSLFPLYVWLLCNILSMMIGFFTVFGDFAATFTNLCIYAIVLSHLVDIENTTEVPIVLPDRKGQVENRPLIGSASTYGAGTGRYR